MVRKSNQIAKPPLAGNMHAGTLGYIKPLGTPTRGIAVVDTLAEMIKPVGLDVVNVFRPKWLWLQHLAQAALPYAGR